MLVALGTSTDDVSLDKPHGICYSNDFIYVCDYNNKRIQVLTEDLKYLKSFQLNYRPWYIQVINNIACIRHFDEEQISFYELPSFIIKYSYSGHNGWICTIRSYFIEFYQDFKMCFFYNKDGLLMQKQKFTFKDDFKFNQFDPITYFNNKLIFAEHTSNKLLYS